MQAGTFEIVPSIDSTGYHTMNRHHAISHLRHGGIPQRRYPASGKALYRPFPFPSCIPRAKRIYWSALCKQSPAPRDRRHVRRSLGILSRLARSSGVCGDETERRMLHAAVLLGKTPDNPPESSPHSAATPRQKNRSSSCRCTPRSALLNMSHGHRRGRDISTTRNRSEHRRASTL